MNRQEKEQQVAWLRNELDGVKALFLTDYRGLTVGEMNSLRTELRNAGISFRVLKNTLALIATKDSEFSAIGDDLVGPRAAAWTKEDDGIPAMAKALIDFAKEKPNLELVGGVYGGKRISVDELKTLSQLPSREELLATLLGTMTAPMSAFVRTLVAVPQSLLNGLKAIEEQKNASPESAAG